MADQTWQIVLTPKERFHLFMLAHAKEQKIKGSDGRRFRRFLRAFGLAPIQDESNDTGKVSIHLTKDKTPSVFTITAENRDYVKQSLITQERTPAVEAVLGDLFDTIEDLKDGEQPALLGDVKSYDAATENWKAETDERSDLVTDLMEAVTGYDEQGQPASAPLANEGVKELIEHAKRMKGAR
jgi:hypothetical protein